MDGNIAVAVTNTSNIHDQIIALKLFFTTKINQIKQKQFKGFVQKECISLFCAKS